MTWAAVSEPLNLSGASSTFTVPLLSDDQAFAVGQLNGQVNGVGGSVQRPNSAVPTVQARAWSLRVNPRPGRADTCMRPSAISSRSLNSGSSQSKCSTQGSIG